MPKSVQFVAAALAVAWLAGPANGEQMPRSRYAIHNGTDSVEDGQFFRRPLGIGKPGFDANADLKGNGVVNALDFFIFHKARRSVHTANGAAAYTRRSANNSATHAQSDALTSTHSKRETLYVGVHVAACPSIERHALAGRLSRVLDLH